MKKDADKNDISITDSDLYKRLQKLIEHKKVESEALKKILNAITDYDKNKNINNKK